MSASPPPPPALPRKPGPFDAPVWGWVVLGSILLFSAAVFLLSLPTLLGRASTNFYRISQMNIPAAEMFWDGVADWASTGSHLIGPILTALFLVVVAVGVLRYRSAAPWITAGPVAGHAMLIVQVAAGEDMWGRVAFWVPGTLAMLVSGAALLVWQKRSPRRQNSPPPQGFLPTVAGLFALGLAMTLWGHSVGAPWAEVAYLWFFNWVRADLALVSAGWLLFSWLGIWLMAEGTSALRPNRKAITAGWACAGMVVALVIWRSPPSDFVNASEGWPLFESGEPIAGTALGWEAPGRWGFDDTSFYPEVSASLGQLLESGRASNPVKLAVTAPRPDFVELMYAPFAPGAEYLAQLRRSNPHTNTGSVNRLMASILAKNPLTDAGADEWLNMVYSLPSSFGEDLALLGNLVGSGRRERAAALATHINEVLARADQAFGAPEGRGLERRLRDEALLAAYERRLDQLGEPDGLSRSISVRVVGAEGLPLAGVPVGIYQRWGQESSYASREGAGVREEEMAFTTGGRFLRTDTAGEALFEDLRAAAYGLKALAGWPDSDLTSGMVATPLSDLPNSLPAGHTEVVWQVLPTGTFTQAPEGPLMLTSAPTGPVVWPCTMRENDIGHRCPEVLDITDQSARQQPRGQEWNRVNAIFELGPDGRPRFVWWFVPEDIEAP